MFATDRLMVYTNDVEIAAWRMDGETDCTERTLTFDGGENTVRWVYRKDKSGMTGEDCAWIDGVTWAPAASTGVVVDAGGGKTVTVPQAWLDEKTVRNVSDTAANGWKVWECYVVGLDPQKTDEFRISAFPMKADGTPDLENLEFAPAQSEWNVPGAKAVIMGAATLGGEWKAVEGTTAAEKAAMRFFKVVVEVP